MHHNTLNCFLGCARDIMKIAFVVIEPENKIVDRVVVVNTVAYIKDYLYPNPNPHVLVVSLPRPITHTSEENMKIVRVTERRFMSFSGSETVVEHAKEMARWVHRWTHRCIYTCSHSYVTFEAPPVPIMEIVVVDGEDEVAVLEKVAATRPDLFGHAALVSSGRLDDAIALHSTIRSSVASAVVPVVACRLTEAMLRRLWLQMLRMLWQLPPQMRSHVPPHVLLWVLRRTLRRMRTSRAMRIC